MIKNNFIFSIGIRKYSGSASYPKDQGMFIGLRHDYMILLALLFQRHLMRISGLYAYVTLNKSKRYFPQFNSKLDESQIESSEEEQEFRD